MLEATWLIPALPLAGFVALLIFGRRLGDPWAGWLATAASAASFVAVVVVFTGLVAEPGEARQYTQVLWTWMPVGELSVDLAFLVDPLSITMLGFISFIATFIHMFSIGYMKGDPGYWRFFAYLNLFLLSMYVLVLGDNMLVTFLGWEGVGTCSYLLVGFWFHKKVAPPAAKKAFVANRVGDFGFLVAMFLVFGAIGSLNYLELDAAASTLAHSTAVAVALLLLLAATGKSAQLPLYMWLPDAMAGPTPVSALIHAATMVTAGVYLLCRVAPVIEVAEIGTAIAWVGGITCVFAATVAIAQMDLKKVLAFSTVSQIGYMIMAVGVGAYAFAIFHMVTHAFFKGCLFLGSGSVIHAMSDEQDMRRMGGLRKVMPITAITFLVAALALAGSFPFSGFWSKDEILLHLFSNNLGVFFLGYVAALGTAFYAFRAYFMTFEGEPRWKRVPEPAPASVGAAAAPPELAESFADDPTGDGINPVAWVDPPDLADEAVRQPPHAEEPPHPHESPWTMTVPLIVLAIGAVFGGVFALPFTESLEFLPHWLEPVFEGVEVGKELSTLTIWILEIIFAATALLGIFLAWQVYLRRRWPARELAPWILQRGWGYNEANGWLWRVPGRRFADAATWFDSNVIDGAVNGAAWAVRSAGRRGRSLQGGFVRAYGVAISVGAVALLVWFLIRAAT